MGIVGCGNEANVDETVEERGNPLVSGGRWSALHQSVLDGNLARVEQLLSEGVDVNVVSKDLKDLKITPLILAVKAGHRSMVERLIDAGADVDQTMTTGESALHMSVAAGDVLITNLLVEAGAREGKASFYTESIWDMAKKSGDPALLEIVNRIQ